MPSIDAAVVRTSSHASDQAASSGGLSHEDRDLFSAIVSSVALGEASSRKLASPFSDLPNDTATITASTDGDAQYENGKSANHEAQVSESEAVSSSNSHEEARQTKSVDTASAHNVASSNHTAVGMATGASTMPKERHTSDEVVYYAPMSDSEPEDGFQAEMMVPTIPVAVLPSTTEANPSMQDEEMVRSPSVSYVDPDEDLAIEQDREGMVDVPLPSVEVQVNAEVQATSITQTLEQVPQADIITEPVEVHPEASTGSLEKMVNKPSPPSSPVHRRPSGTPEPSTPADQGWGISGQDTPAQTLAYDEQDELDELAGGTPRSVDAASTVQANGSQSRISTANGTLSPAPAFPNKGKQRAEDAIEEVGARMSPPASSSRLSEITVNGVADDEQPSTSKIDKGKARARESTPLLASQALNTFMSQATATPSSATTHTSPRALRPAAVRRKYRGSDRFKAAAYLSLDRPEVYLDVAMEDDDKTCWIRCVHWQPEGDDSGQSSDDTDTVTVSARPAAETARRAMQRRIQQAGRTAGTSEQVTEKKVTCPAEVLGELVDDDYAADKWRVLRINNEHSTACEMIMQQIKANEVLESAHIDIQAEDDPELAADILAAKFKEDNDEEMDPALEQAIRESLIEAKKLENSQLEDDFPPYVEEDFNALPDQSTSANLALADEDSYAANESQAGPSGTRNTAESPQPSLMDKDDEASLPPLNQADNSASKESESRNLRSPSPRLPPSLRPGGATSPAASRTEPVTKPYSLMEASTEVSTSKIESGQNQPDDNARSQASHDRSYNSRPARAFSTDVTFCGRPHLEKSIKRVLERKGSDLVLFEDIEGNMTILRFYCKNHEEAIGYSTSGRLDAHMASSSMGDGTQAATCTAFVKAEKQEDIDHWHIDAFSLEHSEFCRAAHERARSNIPKDLNAEAEADGKAEERQSSTKHESPATAAATSIQGPLLPPPSPGSSSQSSSDAGISGLLPSAPVTERNGRKSMEARMMTDSDSGSAGADQSGVPPPPIEVGASYKANDLAKMAQKLSTYMNRGSEVAWTQKPGNAPRSLACRNGRGFHRDPLSQIECDFGISVTYSHQSRLLKVDQVRKNHSSACMAANGNMSTRKKQRSSATGSRSAAARKTGSGITSQPSWLDLVQATESLQSGHTWQVDSVVPLNDIDDTEVSPQAESSSAAQRRTSNAAPAISTADKGKKRGRDNETLPSRSSSSRSTKNARKPSKPRVDGTYNSVHHFIQAVKAYSHSTSPNAELRQSDNLVGKSGSKSKKKVGAVTLQCTFPDCPFYATAKGLQDDRGRELEGFQIKSVVAKHSSECRHNEHVKRKGRNSTSKSVSVIEIESSPAPVEENESDTHMPRVKRKFKQGNASQGSQKRRRIVDSEESASSLPSPPVPQQGPKENRTRRLSTPDEPEMTISNILHVNGIGLEDNAQAGNDDDSPAPFVALQATANSDTEDFFAQYRNIAKEEPQSPGRPNGRISLYTGQMFNSRDEFVNTVLQHTEQSNPGCRLAVANTDPARVRVYCMRADCPYSFNSVYEHGVRRIPAVKVTANHREHSAGCLAFYRRVNQGEQRVHFDPPMVDQEIGDWHDFESAVKAHTDSVNPGCELKLNKTGEHVRVYCPHKDLGCKYSFRAKFDIAEIQEGRVKVVNARSEHSEGCLDHHRRIAEEEEEEEEALNPGVARKRLKPSTNTSSTHANGANPPERRGPPPYAGDVFNNIEEFRAAVNEHSQIVNQGSSLNFRKPTVNNVEITCRNFHTGCRYEFYGALHPPSEDGSRRVIITDVTPDHHEMCVAELVLKGRRPAPDDGPTVRTRRGRATLAGLNGSSSQSSQAGTSLNEGNKLVARKTTQAHRTAFPSHTRLRDDSDSDSGGVALRESNLMSHTSMSALRPATTSSNRPATSGRPPLVPPSLRAGGRPPLVQTESEAAKPVKKTRFEGIGPSSSESSMPASQPQTIALVPGEAATEAAPAEKPRVSLAEVMQGNEIVLLASLGYNTVSDLSDIGVRREDWLDLQSFLKSASLQNFQHFAERSTEGGLDPIQEFLLQRRAQLALMDEAGGGYVQQRDVGN